MEQNYRNSNQIRRILKQTFKQTHIKKDKVLEITIIIDFP